jgi:hypothetical protein
MKPTAETHETFSSGNLESAAFEISSKDMPKIMGMLAKGIYTDKALAVMREYAANGWDAHRMVGKGDVPLEIHVPTRDNPILTIRDFGPGLSHEDVFNVYIKYGDSTKESTNDAVGMLGIGSKSGFAYSDMFTVTSWHGGMKRVYSAMIVENDEGERVGRMSLIHSEVCEPENTGIEIMIAVRQEDVYDFQGKAKELYRHFIPRPNINIALPDAPTEQTKLKNGAISGESHYGSEWIALMGCVPYRVNLTKLDQARLSKCLTNLHGILYFEIGEVTISVSREELEYTRATKDKLLKKFDDLVDEYVMHALTDIEKPGVSDWDKRLKLQVLSALDLPIPEEYEDLARLHAKIKYAPGTFTLLHNNSVAVTITVSSRTRFLMDDTGKALVGYYLTEHDYIVRAAEGKTIEETKTLLESALADSGMGGAKIELLSTLNWTAPYVKPKKITNPKHKAKMFVLKASEGAGRSTPYSDYWDTAERYPEDTDVYVVISGFQGYDNFWDHVRDDFALANYFGVTFPTVYGYKTSEKKPVDVSTIKGTEYRTWRDTFIRGLLTPDNLAKIEQYYWYRPGDSDSHYRYPSGNNLAKIEGVFGSQHPIVSFFTRQRASREMSGLVGRLADRAGISRKASEGGKAYDALSARYPLLKIHGFDELWDSGYYNQKVNNEAWIDYVKAIDERDNLRMHQVTANVVAALDSADGVLSMVS